MLFLYYNPATVKTNPIVPRNKTGAVGMFNWLFETPAWLQAFIIVGGIVIASVAGLLVLRRGIYRLCCLQGEHSEAINEAISFFGAAMGVFYGLTASLIAINTWQSYTELRGLASREAASLAALYRDASGYPEPIRGKLEEELRKYTRHVIEVAWPAAARGEIVDVTTRQVNDFMELLYRFQPQDEGQKIIHAETVGRFNELVERRRQRIEQVGESLPGPLWGVVLVGAFLSITVSYFFYFNNIRLHVLMTAMLATFIGLLTFAIVIFDQPCRGELRVRPSAYELVLDRVMHGRGDDHDPSR